MIFVENEATHLLDQIKQHVDDQYRATVSRSAPTRFVVYNVFLERIAAGKTVGGWVVIAKILEGQLDRDFDGAFVRCRNFIIAAGVWHAADTMGEGVAGEALVAYFQPALEQIAPWRENTNPWVRRAVGVAAHFWAKRSRGAAEHTGRAKALLALLESMFEEWDMIAVKGVGWGLKTLGRCYPELMVDWLVRQASGQRRYRALMLRKALTYLSDGQRDRVKRDASNVSLADHVLRFGGCCNETEISRV